MNITGSTLSADAVRAYLHSKEAEKEAKQRAFEASTKIELDKLHESFDGREVQPEAMDRIATLVRKTIDMGDKQALVLRFPSDWLPDQGRAITNHDKDWYDKLDGFPRRAYDFFKRELEPRGFQIRAGILNWPGGMPGEVGFYLQWKASEEI
jgi:hypothetical protein